MAIQTRVGRAYRKWLSARLRAPRTIPGRLALICLLGLPSPWASADLVYSRLETVDGAERWSATRAYADAESADPRLALPSAEPPNPVDVRVFLVGEITRADVYGARVMERMVKQGRQRISGNAITLAGNGGDADAAMEVGRLLRKLGLATRVAAGERCLSSCVFAFMGGDRRTVEGQLGIHRPYFSSARKVPDRRSYYRQLQKRLLHYIEDMDLPSSLYEAIMAVPPESMTILSDAQLKRYYLQGMSPAAEDEADAAAAAELGLTMAEYMQRKAQQRSCAENSVACGGDAQKSAARSADAKTGAASSRSESRPRQDDANARARAQAEGPGTSRGEATGPVEPN